MKKSWLPTKEISNRINLKIIGLLSSPSFHHAKYLAEMLCKYQKHKYNTPQYRSLMEFDWLEYRYKLNKNVGGQAWALIKDVAVFWDDVLLGNENDLFNVIETSNNLFIKNMPERDTFVAEAKKAREQYFKKDPDRAFVFFEISEYETTIGTFLFELYSDLLPVTCDRFMYLCINHPLKHKHKHRTYTGAKFHRIVKSGWLQGGDIGWKHVLHYPDECYAVAHDRRGILSLSHCDRDKNGAQFFINFNPAPWMDTYYVAIGHIIEGHSLLQRLENVKTFYENPCSDFVIKNSGVLPYGRGIIIRTEFLNETIRQVLDKFEYSIRHQHLNLIQNKLTTFSKFKMIQRSSRDSSMTIVDKLAVGKKSENVTLDKNAADEKLVKDILRSVMGDTFKTAALHQVHPDTDYANEVPSDEMLKERYDLGFYSEPVLRASLLEEFLNVCYARGFFEKPPERERELKSWDLSGNPEAIINSILNDIIENQCTKAENRKYFSSIIDKLIDDVPNLSEYEKAVCDQAKLLLSDVFKEAVDELKTEICTSFDSENIA